MTYFFEKTPGIFGFVHFTLGKSRENKISLMEILQNCVTKLGNSNAKNQDPLEILHYFYLIIPGNSTSFLIDP